MQIKFGLLLVAQLGLFSTSSAISLRKCPIVACTALYAPVCDSNGVTHSSPCMFASYQCTHPEVTIVHDGPCETEDLGCKVVDCKPGYTCVEEKVVCIKAPCPVLTKCVPQTECKISCGPYQVCDIYNGESYCKDTCAEGRCPKGSVCTLQQVQCVRAPCPPIAKCSKPISPCATTLCPEGKKCVEVTNPCFVAPCPVEAMCV